MKTRFIIIIFLLSTIISNAQDFQFNFSTGYAIPSFKQTVEGYNNTKIDETNTFKTEIANPFSLGTGIYFDAALEFGFHENIAVSLDVSYLLGRKINLSQEDAIASVVSLTEQELFGNSLRLIPSIIIRAEENTLRPYLKLGYIMSMTNVELHEKTTIHEDVTLKEWEYQSKGNYGISFAGGLSYQIMKNTALFLELNYQTIKYKPTTSSMVIAKENGKNTYDDYLVIEKEISYSSDIDLNYNMSPDPQKPQLLHEIFFPYSSLIFQFGIKTKLH
ncbi:MAG: hypothetical protein K9J13_02980 [Saprospiraceae bacterium]|nr:hypothetical protein [Saprospiraceae bacterium]